MFLFPAPEKVPDCKLIVSPAAAAVYAADIVANGADELPSPVSSLPEVETYQSGPM